ncbi:MAG: carboxypeptidase regulatory-like domain-containing protein, partial [Acidobacteriaceae bacterium]|nr:carboxypeptidase regulatory-like domain-containing protein [Acidobacteriaceae bacterium]
MALFARCRSTGIPAWFCLLGLFIGPGVFGVLQAQEASATVNGLVSDPSGAAVPNAQVSLTNTQTAVTKNTNSNNNGAYAFLNIVPGVYTVQASAPGFATQTQPNITLEVNQTATLDFHLTVGAANTTVTVEAVAAGVETATAELGTVVTKREVTDLPLNGRNFTQLLTITPGVVNIHTDQSAGGGGGFVGNALGNFSFPSVNGSRVRSNTFLLDGVNNLNTFLSTYNFQPIVDDIQEFKTQGHNDLAEYGGVTGGIVNVVSKSGTNDYHGTLWEFLRNEQMDARGFFGAARTPLRQNQFGAAAGGPVLIPKLYNGRNKSFFYAAYEAYRQRLFNESGTLVPSDAERGGNFSEICAAGFTNGLCNNPSQQIYNPFTTTYNAATNSYSRQPFPGNVIPSGLISPIAQAYQNIVPHAGTLINGSNLFEPNRSQTNQDSGSIRGDQYIKNSDQIMFRFSKYYQVYDVPSSVIGYSDSDIFGYNIAAHETHTFGPTAILDVYFGRNYGINDQTAGVVGETTSSSFMSQLSSAGMAAAMLNNAGYSYAPSIGVSGYVSTPNSFLQDTGLADVFQYGGNFTKIIGTHTLKLGVDFETNNFTSPIRYTNEAFGTAQSGGLGALQGVGGNAWASFLLGVPSGASIRGVNEVNHGGWDNAFYIQDQWKATPKLTVNLGFRNDMKIEPIYGAGKDLYTGDADAVTGQYILTAVPPNCSATVGAPCLPNGIYVQGGGPDPYNGLPPHVIVAGSDHRIVQNSLFNWAGRVGLGYRLTDRIAVRAAYGRFYDMWGAVTQLAQNFGGNWPAVATINNPLLNQNVPNALINNPLGLGTSAGIVYPPATFSQVSQWMVDPKFKTPYMDQWNFGVEDQIMTNTVLSVNYVGSVGRHLDWGPEQNTAVTPGPGNFQDRQPFPYMLPQWFDQSVGNSRYNALQVTVNKRSSSGMAFLLSYTLSRSTDDGCSADIGADCSVQNVYNRAADVGLSSFNEKQVFSASFTMQSPFGKSRWNVNKLVNGIAGGWLLNGIVQLGSGFPYEVDTSTSTANVCGCNTERANLVGDPNAGHLGVNTTWFNTAAFANPAPYTFGNEKRNSLVGDWQRNVDLSLFRQFHIGLGETRYFEFRAEAFNVFNNVVFNNPDANMTDPNYGRVTLQANAPRQL